jgi:hypothetical protein
MFPGEPSRISTIFYLGLEGTGGLEMETEEEDDVRSLHLPSCDLQVTVILGH